MSNTITIAEFKAWLDGVIEMQPEDWAPDMKQWKKILTKIESISDEVSAPTVNNFSPNPMEQIARSNSVFTPQPLLPPRQIPPFSATHPNTDDSNVYKSDFA